MNTTIANQRILIVDPAFSIEEAQQKAWIRKTDAFGTLTKVTGLISKPKDDDFSLVYSEERYEPIWHVAATARYVFDRNNLYSVPFRSPDVQSVSFNGQPLKGSQGLFQLELVEHCRQECSDEALVDGVLGKKNPDFKRIISAPAREIAGEINGALHPEAIIVPPQFRISGIIRNTMSKIITGVEADTMHEEQLDITIADLYYHPIYAFQYHWKSKDRQAIVEVDGVTGDVRAGTRTYAEYLGKIMDQQFLTDLGADAAGLFIPGGSIAVKLAKKCVDSIIPKKKES